MQGFPPFQKNMHWSVVLPPSKLLHHAASQNGSNRGATSGHHVSCIAWPGLRPQDKPHGSVLMMAVTRVANRTDAGRRHRRQQEVFARANRMVPNTATTMRDEGRRRRGRRTRRPHPPREAGGDSGADVIARVDGRRDDRAATIESSSSSSSLWDRRG